MHGFKPRSVVLPALLLLGALPAAAGRGAAELALDRGLVRELLASSLPEPLVIDVPGVGRGTLRLGPPKRVEFREGAVEAVLPLQLVETGWSALLEVRLVPSFDPLTGRARLRADSVRPSLSIPFHVDLSGWVEAIELPGTLSWPLTMPGKAGMRVDCFLQGLEVREDRMVLLLGVSLN